MQNDYLYNLYIHCKCLGPDMVIENRVLEFSLHELKTALEVFQEEKLSIYPTGKIIGIALHEIPSITAKILVISATDGTETETVIDSNTLAALILYFCHHVKIPIPRSSKKELGKIGDGISLSITMGNN